MSLMKCKVQAHLVVALLLCVLALSAEAEAALVDDSSCSDSQSDSHSIKGRALLQGRKTSVASPPTLAPTPDLQGRELFPAVGLDLLECFSKVVADRAVPHADALGRSSLEYFLFMGSNLAVARGGEATPYDHDLDVAIDPNHSAAFSALWMGAGKLRAHQAQYPACRNSDVSTELCCGECGHAGKEYFLTCTAGSMERKCNDLDDCKLMRLWSGGGLNGHGSISAIAMDVWEVPVPDPENHSRACHWGFCMEMSDVLPTQDCTFRSTPHGRRVTTRCLRDPRSWARFYSLPDMNTSWRSASWEQPKYNFWNGSAWEWCEGAWEAHTRQGGQLFVYDHERVGCASFNGLARQLHGRDDSENAEVDSNKVLDRTEFSEKMQELQPGLGDVTIARAFNAMDADGDGVVSEVRMPASPL